MQGSVKAVSDASDRMGGSPRILVVAAWEPELERFRSLARGQMADEVGLDVGIEPIGIGPVDSAAHVTRCILQQRPGLVVLLGTCGAAPGSGIHIGDAIAGASVRLVDPCVIAGRAAMPYAKEEVGLDDAIQAAVVACGGRAATIANTLGVTADDALAAELAPLGEVEHLEAYGVARACQLASVRCAVVLGVANLVGARGHEGWRANHVEASARAAELAHRALVKMSTTRRSPG